MRVVLYGPFLDHQVHLANALPKNVEILMLLPVPSLPERITKMVTRDAGIHVLSIGESARYSVVLPRLLETWKRLKAFDPDVVHVQLGGGWTELAVFPLLMSHPMVVTFHDVESHLGEGSSKVSLSRGLFRRSCDRIIVHGHSLRERMMNEFSVPSEKIAVVPLGAPELEAFKMHEKAGVVEEGNIVLFFGRILEYKGLDYLIKAEPYISAEIPNVKIVIAGEGEDFGKYRMMMAGREDKFIVLNRRISFEEAAELFQRCSVVVLPYVEASQSAVIPIAYGFRKAVVATNTGSIPEVVHDGDTGLVVPPRDSKALARAVVQLLKDKNLRNGMGTKGQEMLTTALSWERIAVSTMEVYETAIESRKRHGRS